MNPDDRLSMYKARVAAAKSFDELRDILHDAMFETERDTFPGFEWPSSARTPRMFTWEAVLSMSRRGKRYFWRRGNI